MKSSRPKVLHSLAGRPLVYYPAAAAFAAGADRLVVVVSPNTRQPVEAALTGAFGEARVSVSIQDPPRGTGDAARVGLAQVEAGQVLVLYGDTPLLQPDELRALCDALREQPAARLSMLTCSLDDPTGYGRILRDTAGRVVEVREHRDLYDDEQRAITEVNAGMYSAEATFLKQALARLQPTNAQGEYYLTDVVAAAARDGGATTISGGTHSLVGVNDRAQLAAAESAMYARIAERHARSGVTVRGTPRIDEMVSIGPDATIEAGVSLRGRTSIGAGATVEVGCVITDARIGDGAVVQPYSVVTGGEVSAGARVGPFADLGPQR
jgi:bifunctional UDP-N-acetylglucosamine pyrophosphorylase/glucosamine-1-phosphate N-acetyltransferase